MNFLRRHRLRRALDSFVTVLGPALKQRYGKVEQYTVMQVRKTLSDLKLGERYVEFAIAMFRHEESANTLRLLSIDQLQLLRLRQEIADRYFDGNRRFSVGDVLGLNATRGWQGGPAPSWRANRYGRTSL